MISAGKSAPAPQGAPEAELLSPGKPLGHQASQLASTWDAGLLGLEYLDAGLSSAANALERLWFFRRRIRWPTESPGGPQKGRALLLQVQHNHVYQNSRCQTKIISTFHGFGNSKPVHIPRDHDWIA